MSRWLLLALALLLLGARLAQADVPGFGPRPRRPMPVHPSNAVPIVIQAGAKGEPARLLIPRPLLERAKKVTPGERFGALGLPIPLVAMGTISLTGLGLVCLRSRRLTWVPLVFLSFVAIGNASASLLWANAPPPSPAFDSPKSALLVDIGKEYKLDGLRVEITDEGDTLRLILPVGRLAASGRGR
jgi:hypothetical protein